jgi:hypothetical protein
VSAASTHETSIVRVRGSTSTNIRPRARVDDGRHRGHERKRRRHHFVGTHVRRQQGEVQRAGAAVDAHGVPHPAEPREGRLEGRDLRAEDELAAFDDAGDGRSELLPQRAGAARRGR